MKRYFIMLMVLLLFIPQLFSEGNKEDAKENMAKIELFWESGDLQGYERDMLNQLLDDFQKANPSIQISNNPFSGKHEDYEAKLLTRLNSKKGPDLFEVGDNTLFRYAKNHFAAPIPGEFAKSLKTRFSKNIEEGMTTALSWDGILYGAPWNADWVSLWYNTDMYKEAGLDVRKPPATLDELRQYAIKLTKRDGNKISRSGISLRATSGGSGQTDKWINFLTSKGGRIYSKDMSKVVVNSPAGVAALQYYLTLIYDDKVDALDLEPRDSKGFAQGKTAMFGRGPWVLSFLKGAAPDLKYAVAPFPGESAPFVDGIMVNVDSKNKSATWTFLKWFMKSENFGRWQKAINSIPLFQDVSSMKYFQENEILRAFGQQPLYNTPQHARLLEMNSILGDYMAKAVYKTLSPKEALDQAAKKMEVILNEK